MNKLDRETAKFCCRQLQTLLDFTTTPHVYTILQLKSSLEDIASLGDQRKQDKLLR